MVVRLCVAKTYARIVKDVYFIFDCAAVIPFWVEVRSFLHAANCQILLLTYNTYFDGVSLPKNVFPSPARLSGCSVVELGMILFSGSSLPTGPDNDDDCLLFNLTSSCDNDYDDDAGGNRERAGIVQMLKALRMLRLLKLSRQYDGSIVIYHALKVGCQNEWDHTTRTMIHACVHHPIPSIGDSVCAFSFCVPTLYHQVSLSALGVPFFFLMVAVIVFASFM